MAEYRLHCFAQSGNAYKAALMLNLCGADWEPQFVDFFKGEMRTPEYRAMNEMGEVPVLEHRGRAFSQSGVILDYLAAQLGRFGWKNEEERREVLRWILYDNHKVSSYIGILRYLVAFAKTGETPLTEFFRGRLANVLKVLNGRFAERPFVIGEEPTIADISLCSYLFWNDEYGVSWDDYPHIAGWLDRIKALPGWVHPYELMPGHPLPG